MAQKTKTTGTGTIAALLAVAAIGGVAMYGSKNRNRGDERILDVSSSWTTELTGIRVHIDVYLNNAPIHSEPHERPVFRKTFKAKPGDVAEVLVRIVGAGPIGAGCSLFVNGAEVDSDWRDTVNTNQLVTCKATII